MSSLGEPLHGFAPKIVPFVLTLALAVLSVIPIAIPDYAAVTPNFVLMSIYHWTIYRPELLPYWSVFVIGLFTDLLTAAPGTTIGVTPLILLIVRAVVLANRRSFIGRNFPLVWLGFALLTVLVNLVSWGIGCLLNGVWLEPRSFAFEAVLTVAFFPVATWLFARVQRATAVSG